MTWTSCLLVLLNLRISNGFLSRLLKYLFWVMFYKRNGFFVPFPDSRTRPIPPKKLLCSVSFPGYIKNYLNSQNLRPFYTHRANFKMLTSIERLSSSLLVLIYHECHLLIGYATHYLFCGFSNLIIRDRNTCIVLYWKVASIISKVKGIVNCVLVYGKWFQIFFKPLGELIIVRSSGR